MSGKASRVLFAFLVTGLVLFPITQSVAQEVDVQEEAAAVATEEGAAAVETVTETVSDTGGQGIKVQEEAVVVVTEEGAVAVEETTVTELTPEGAVEQVTEVTAVEASAAGLSGADIAIAKQLAPPRGPFSRHADPIVLKGEQVPRFEGLTEGMLRVFANKDGKGLRPIPYQMDERNQWGEFVVVKGKRVVRDEDDGAFDENDEIVFLTRDLGTKVEKSAWPTGTKEAYEVEVTDPLTFDKAYAYVVSYASESAAPPPSTTDYISYEEKGDGITHALNYDLGFVEVVSGLDYDVLTVKPAAGGSGEDWFDRLKVRVIQNLRRFLTFGIPARLDRTEKNFLVKVYGYKDGPVRVLRVMKVNLQLIWKLPAPGATVNNVFYPEWIEIPVPINLPFKPSWAFYNIELDVSHDYDFDPNSGVLMFSSHDGVWNAVDGKMSESETSVNKANVKGGYYGFDATAAGHGAGFYTVRPPKSFSTEVLGLYLDSTESATEPEYYKGDGKKKSRGWVEGALPLAGARFIEWGDVGKGIHTVFFYQFYPPFYKRGDEKAFLDIIDHPVSVTVN